MGDMVLPEIRCPVCKMPTGTYLAAGLELGTTEERPYPFYSRNYHGKPGHITPRCFQCYDKAEKQRAKKEAKALCISP